MEEKITIIVPVYNVEKYLRRCLDSIIKQSYKNLEIILVDDGSTDNSLAICNEYKAKDNRIIIIHKENGGLSSARNAGLDIATGEYIGFVDSDDEILENMYETLYKNIKETNCDIAAGRFIMILSDGEEQLPPYNTDDKDIVIMSGIDRWFYLYLSWVAIVQVNKLFKRHIFENLRFKEGAYYEDEYIIHLEYEKAKRIVYVPTVLYRYYYRDDSITNKKEYNRAKKFDQLDSQKERAQYFENKKQYLLQYLQLRLITSFNDDFENLSLEEKEYYRDIYNEVLEYAQDKINKINLKRFFLTHPKQHLIYEKYFK